MSFFVYLSHIRLHLFFVFIRIVLSRQVRLDSFTCNYNAPSGCCRFVELSLFCASNLCVRYFSPHIQSLLIFLRANFVALMTLFFMSAFLAMYFCVILLVYMFWVLSVLRLFFLVSIHVFFNSFSSHILTTCLAHGAPYPRNYLVLFYHDVI